MWLVSFMAKKALSAATRISHDISSPQPPPTQALQPLQSLACPVFPFLLGGHDQPICCKITYFYHSDIDSFRYQVTSLFQTFFLFFFEYPLYFCLTFLQCTCCTARFVAIRLCSVQLQDIDFPRADIDAWILNLIVQLFSLVHSYGIRFPQPGR